MTKNQKIAIGCGAVGCLGLIILMIAAGAGYYFYSHGHWNSNSNSNSDFDYNSNSNSNINSNYESDEDSSEESTPEPSVSDTSEDTSSTTSDDNKHRLFQAGATCADPQLMMQVNKKVGITGGASAEVEQFTKDHIVWVLKNSEFIQRVNTRDKACAYVREHIND